MRMLGWFYRWMLCCGGTRDASTSDGAVRSLQKQMGTRAGLDGAQEMFGGAGVCMGALLWLEQGRGGGKLCCPCCLVLLHQGLSLSSSSIPASRCTCRKGLL